MELVKQRKPKINFLQQKKITKPSFQVVKFSFFMSQYYVDDSFYLFVTMLETYTENNEKMLLDFEYI